MKKDLVILALIVAVLVGWLVRQTAQPEPETGRISLADVLGEAPEHYRRVTEPVPLEFPADHGSHPDYRSEWWYFTGNLDTGDGRRLGFQYTLFRFGLDQSDPRDSQWTASDTWMAHLALSDGREQRFFQSERFARGALDLAGATPKRWWLRDWQVETRPDGWTLDMDAGEFALDLDLTLTRPIILQGDQGYSRKGPEPGNASRYYSATRLAAKGRVRLDDQWQAVTGQAWLDREWGSGQLSETLAGWDWFALQFDDGRDVMVYRLRDHEGEASPWSAGIVVETDGSARILAAEDFTATVARWWTDPHGTRWPLEWELDIVPANLSVRVKPVFDAQRWHQSVPYWEGMVDITDHGSGQSLGRGYLELSGYAEPAIQR